MPKNNQHVWNVYTYQLCGNNHRFDRLLKLYKFVTGLYMKSIKSRILTNVRSTNPSRKQSIFRKDLLLKKQGYLILEYKNFIFWSKKLAFDQCIMFDSSKAILELMSGLSFVRPSYWFTSLTLVFLYNSALKPNLFLIFFCFTDENVCPCFIRKQNSSHIHFPL